MRSVDAEVVGHTVHMNLTWNCKSCVGVAFLFSVRMLTKRHHFGVKWTTRLCEKKLRDTFLYTQFWMP